jgi:hypothetical protein
MLPKVLPVAALVLACGATAATAQAATISLGTPSLSGRVAITEPVTVSCSPFDPSLTLFQESVNVSVEQASGRSIARGSGFAAASCQRFCSPATAVRTRSRSPPSPTPTGHRSTAARRWSAPRCPRQQARHASPAALTASSTSPLSRRLPSRRPCTSTDVTNTTFRSAKAYAPKGDRADRAGRDVDPTGRRSVTLGPHRPAQRQCQAVAASVGRGSSTVRARASVL